MKKHCILLLDTGKDDKFLTDGAEDGNWKVGDKLFFDDKVGLVLSLEVNINGIREYRIKWK